MQIDFVNHASLVITHGSVRLLSDPWLHGSAFNEGWALLSRTAFEAADFEDITHIWYSHEHRNRRVQSGIDPAILSDSSRIFCWGVHAIIEP